MCSLSDPSVSSRRHPDGLVLSPDHSLADNRIPAEGAKALGEALKINNALRTLKYATSYPANLLSEFVYCQQPQTPDTSLVVSVLQP